MRIGADTSSDGLLRDFLGKGPILARAHGDPVGLASSSTPVARPPHRSIGQILRSAVMAGMAVAAVVHAVDNKANAADTGDRGRAVLVQAAPTANAVVSPETSRDAQAVLFAADSASFSMPVLYRALPQLAEDWESATGRLGVRIADMRVRGPSFGATSTNGWEIDGADWTKTGPEWSPVGSMAAVFPGDDIGACVVTIADTASDMEGNSFMRTMLKAMEARGIQGDAATDAFWTLVTDHEIGHCSHRDGAHADMDSDEFGGSAGTLLQEMMADGWMMALDYVRNGGDTSRSEAWMDGRMIDLVRSGLLANIQHVAQGEVPEPMLGRVSSSAAASYATPLMRDAVLEFLRSHSPEEIGAMARRMSEGEHDMIVDGVPILRNELGRKIRGAVQASWEAFVYGEETDDRVNFMKGPADLSEGMASARMVDGHLVLGTTTPAFFADGIADAIARTGWTPEFLVEPNMGRSVPRRADVDSVIQAAFQGQDGAVGYQLLEQQTGLVTVSAAMR